MEMGLRPGKVVAGEPYSATTTNSMKQTLADGNTISRVITGQAARDSEGRTYAQQNMTGGPWGQGGAVSLVFISDPVAGYSYILNASKKTALRRPFRERTNDAPRETARNRNRVETDLGEQTISGVIADGKRIIHTIPAGQIGNAEPLVVKSEIWTDPQLQVVVQATYSDPRWGTSTYSLTNIQRAEPNAALFQVPAGYTVSDAPVREGPR